MEGGGVEGNERVRKEKKESYFMEWGGGGSRGGRGESEGVEVKKN